MTTTEHVDIDQDTLDAIVAFHGHLCPGLSMGVQAARLALRDIGAHSREEEVVAAVETDMCAVDAIQYLTGCTFGKGNLIHRDWGKNAYTFFRRSDGKAIRVAARPQAWGDDPERQQLREKISAGHASEQERTRFHELHEARAYALLDAAPRELFTVTVVDEQPPSKARLHASLACADCGEHVMEIRVRRLDGHNLCQPCFEHALASR